MVLADVDAELLLDGVEHVLAAAHVAGRAEADADHVLAARHGREERVEADDAGDLAVGLAEAEGDRLEGALGQVAEDPLGDLQHRDQGAGLAPCSRR